MSDLVAAAARVAAKRRELELRLQQLHETHPLQRVASMRLVAACYFELLDHQGELNDVLIAHITGLAHGERAHSAPGPVL